MNKQVYIISVERKDGSTAYLRAMNSVTRSAANTGLTLDPAQARHFDTDTDKADIIYWMDVERPKITKWANTDTLKIMRYVCTVVPVSADDIEWRTVLQRTAVSKLSNLEIEALGLEKYEIERRLSQ